jgi:tetratricopeptide (TPR) repeat protein
VHALSTRRSSALITLSDMLRRPRLSPLVVLLVFAFGGLGVWGFIQWRRPRLHVPTAESQRLFDTGTNALRTGSFFQASKVLALAVQSDDRFALAHARLAEAWTELDYAGKAKDELLRVGELTPDRSLFPLVDALYLDAVTATVRRDFAKAVEAYAEIARQQPDQPQVYVDLGRAYEKNNQLDKAIESYGMAIGHDQQNATAFLRLGILYGRKHDLPAATTTFDKAAELYQALSNIEGSTEVAFQRGVLLNDIQGQIAEARAQLERARDMANVNKSHYQLIKILFQLSNVSLKEGKTDQAQQEAREAVESAQANQMESLSARGSIDLGYVYLVRADYQNAERYFKQALDLAQGFGGLQNQARAQLSLASLYMQRGEADLALSYEEPALTFYQNGGYRTETSQALLLRGRAFKQKGDYNSALQSFQQQLQIAEQTGDQSQIAYSHGSMGNLLYEQERYAEAREHFGESYERYKSAGNQLYQGYALMNLSAALWGLGHFDDARNMLNQASDIASRKSSDLKGLQTSINLLEADMSLSERHFPEVLSKSRQAMDLAGTQNLSVTVEGKYLIGLAQALSGQTRAGQTTCQEATDAAAPLGDPLLLSRSQLALAEASLAAGDTQRAIASAKQAQAFFAGAGLSASEWRSWLIAGLASQKSGDRDKAQLCLTKAAETLASLQQKWGTEVFNNYVSRPDVQVYRKQLGDYVSMAKP